MTDSVATIDVKLDSVDIESEVGAWLSGNAVTSVDDTETVRVGSNRGIIIIMYTA